MKQLTLIKVAGVVCSLAAFGIAGTASSNGETLAETAAAVFGTETTQATYGKFDTLQGSFRWEFREISEGVWTRRKFGRFTGDEWLNNGEPYSNFNDGDIANVLSNKYDWDHHTVNDYNGNIWGTPHQNATTGILDDIEDLQDDVAALQDIDTSVIEEQLTKIGSTTEAYKGGFINFHFGGDLEYRARETSEGKWTINSYEDGVLNSTVKNPDAEMQSILMHPTSL